MSDPEKTSLGGEVREVVDDASGVSVRALRTIADLFIRPRAVFEALIEDDRSAYVRPFRLWLTFVGIQFFIVWLMGGYGEFMGNVDAAQGGSLADAIQESGRDPGRVLAIYGDRMTTFQTLAFGVGALPGLFLLRAFSKRGSIARHFQIFFALMLTAAVANLAMVPLGFRSPTFLWLGGALSIALIIITFSRGGAGLYHHSTTGVLAKGIGLLAAILVGLFVATMALAAVVFVTAMQAVPPE